MLLILVFVLFVVVALLVFAFVGHVACGEDVLLFVFFRNGFVEVLVLLFHVGFYFMLGADFVKDGMELGRHNQLYEHM